MSWARIGPVLWLTGVWVLLWGSLTPLNVVSGLLLATFVVLVFPQPEARLGARLRLVPALALLGHFVLDLVQASVQVAWLAVRPGPPPGGIVVDLRLRSDNAFFQTLTAEMTALVPGSVVVDLDSETRLLTLHVIDIGSSQEAAGVRERVLLQEHRVRRALDPTYERQP